MSERNESDCRACLGRGTRRAFVGGGVVEHPCRACLGTGRVTAAERDRQDAGDRLRAARMSIRGVSLRRAAQVLGVSPTYLSQCEQGVGDVRRIDELRTKLLTP